MSTSLPTPAFLYTLNILLSPTLPKFPVFRNCHATPKGHGLPPPPQKKILNVHKSEIISRLINESNYVPLTIESDGTDPIKYYSTSAAAKHCGVTKQTLDYAHRNRCTRIVRRKGGVKEFRITWL